MTTMNKFLCVVSDMHLKYGTLRRTKFDILFRAHARASRAPLALFPATRNDRALTLAMLSQGCDPFLPNG